MKRRVLTLLATAVLAACGGGSGDDGNKSSRQFEVVSFGDSLSDVGTYQVGGGRYTTNPGSIWTERVARYYGGELKPAAKGGFGLPEAAVGGLGYAQGGARVNTALPATAFGPLARPISSQVDAYLDRFRYKGGFNDRQLVLVQGGANDIINAIRAAASDGSTQAAVETRVAAAAVELAAQVGRMAQANATRVVVANVPDISLTPLAVRYPQLAPAFRNMTVLFNDTLALELSRQAFKPQRLVVIDSYRWMQDVFNLASFHGFSVANAGVACDSGRIRQQAFDRHLPDPARFIEENGAALLCSPSTLATPDADQTYMFADDLHPSTRLHELYARFIEGEIDRTVAR